MEFFVGIGGISRWLRFGWGFAGVKGSRLPFCMLFGKELERHYVCILVILYVRGALARLSGVKNAWRQCKEAMCGENTLREMYPTDEFGI